MGSEQRRSVRMKTFLKGRIAFNSGSSTMDCLIRDLSPSGARLELSETAALPEVFDLFVPTKDSTYRATLRWRREGSIGVTFDDHNQKSAARPAVALGVEPAPPADLSMAVLLRRITELEAENAALRAVLAAGGPARAPATV